MNYVDQIRPQHPLITLNSFIMSLKGLLSPPHVKHHNIIKRGLMTN